MKIGSRPIDCQNNVGGKVGIDFFQGIFFISASSLRCKLIYLEVIEWQRRVGKKKLLEEKNIEEH
jgi:hypothetical protein